MYIYPRLTLSAAVEATKIVSSVDPLELRRRQDGAAVIDPSALFSPTGGHRVNQDHLKMLRKLVRELADSCSFPEPPDMKIRQSFDMNCGIILYEKMEINPSEASSLGVWAHMTCILLPDIVRWRFWGDTTSEDRFIGSARGLRRNTFGRLWWRSYLLRDESNKENPYYLLSQFGEDDLVQITERPSLAGSSRLAKQILYSFLNIAGEAQSVVGEKEVKDRPLLRDAVKRIRRLLPFIMFDALDDQTLKTMVDDPFKKSADYFSTVNSKSNFSV